MPFPQSWSIAHMAIHLKNHLNQPKVAEDVAEQIGAGQEGIVGMM